MTVMNHDIRSEIADHQSNLPNSSKTALMHESADEIPAKVVTVCLAVNRYRVVELHGSSPNQQCAQCCRFGAVGSYRFEAGIGHHLKDSTHALQ